MIKEEYKLHPIGYVRLGADGFYLDIEPEYLPALNGLLGFSHIQVVWWCHLFDEAPARQILTAEQPYKNAPASLGIFATRSPIRPNPIALTVAYVLDIDEQAGKIHIPYIDAEEGTPILDIKPYHPSVDRVREASVPKWCSHWPKWVEDSAEFDWEAEFVNAR